MKLIKDHDYYHLIDDERFVIATTDIELLECTPKLKLSLKNCQAIERGYDLDELCNNSFDRMGYHSTVTPHEEKQFKLGYKLAAQEIIEIIGDKKFSVEDMLKAFEKGSSFGTTKLGNTHYFDELIQSLQPTEWDVEIVTDVYPKVKEFKDDGETHAIEIENRPKLDPEGNLILKRL